MRFLPLHSSVHCEEWMYCVEIKHVFNDNGLMWKWMEEDWIRATCRKKIRSQHLQGTNIIGSQKECLCASAVVNSPFVSQGLTISAIVLLLRKGIGFIFSDVFPFSLGDGWFFAHQWTDIIRTCLCVLFIKGNQLYLWPIHIAKTQTMGSVSGWWHVGKKIQSTCWVVVYQNKSRL